MASEKFVRCIDDGGDPISLTVGEYYESLPISAVALAHNWLRVINNTGDAHDYPAHLFDPALNDVAVNQDRAAELLAMYREGRLTPEEHTQLIALTTLVGTVNPQQVDALTELTQKLNVSPATLLSNKVDR